MESIQRELGKGDDENAPAWSRSILRAANFLADKLANAPKEEPKGALSTAFAQKPPAKPPAYPQSMMKKSSSVGGGFSGCCMLFITGFYFTFTECSLHSNQLSRKAHGPLHD